RGLIGPGMLSRFRDDREIDATLVAEISRHVQVHLARVGPVHSIDLLPHDAIALAVVWHNLLSMTHPDVVGRRRLRRRVRGWLQGMLDWIGPPRSSHDVALRYGMFAQLGSLGRVDTDIAFWAGSARYVGVAPPRRMVVWRGLRRIRESKKRVSLIELLAELQTEHEDADLLPAARVAFALSPLNDMDMVDRAAPFAFSWTPQAVNTLGDPPLRGAAMRLILARAGGPEALSRRIRAAETATQDAARSEALPIAAAQMLLLFHIEMLCTEALTSATPPKGHALAWDAIARLEPARAARIAGIDTETFERTLGLDVQRREPLKDAPAAALLARAGFREVTS
ncbi:MAG: hypothetical protein WCJ30_10960, partial [Deltaproteobacteria bacterium]